MVFLLAVHGAQQAIRYGGWPRNLQEVPSGHDQIVEGEGSSVEGVMIAAEKLSATKGPGVLGRYFIGIGGGNLSLG